MSNDPARFSGDSARPALDVQLRHYNRSYRRRLRKIAKSSSRLADLLYSYPAAAFVIAAQAGNPLLRAQAVRLVKDGASLNKVAQSLALPMWTRRLPPESFTGSFAPLPGGQRFSRCIVNLIPKDPDNCAAWFNWVATAHNLCHEDFALWVARLSIWNFVFDDPDVLLPLAAFVWFKDAEGTRARGMIDKPWTPQLGLGKAVEAARGWFIRMLLEDCRSGSGWNGRWFVAQRACGLRIVPLRKPRDLEDEGRRMNNCVGDYITAVAAGECLIYSVRRGNKHIATLEVKPNHAMDGTAQVAQLLGPHNEEVDEPIRRAVDSWLKRQGDYPGGGRDNYALAGFMAERWAELLAPYWQAKGKPATSSGLPIAQQPILMHRALQALACYA